MIFDPRPCGECAVCGCGAVSSDEVSHHGRLLLRECTRCRHRWTEAVPELQRRPSRIAQVRTTRRAREEVAHAA